jgi:hypothetical protein
MLIGSTACALRFGRDVFAAVMAKDAKKSTPSKEQHGAEWDYCGDKVQQRSPYCAPVVGFRVRRERSMGKDDKVNKGWHRS